MFRQPVQNVIARVTGGGRVYSKRMLKKLRGHPRKWKKPEPELEPLRWQPSWEGVQQGAYGWAPPTGTTPEGVPFSVTRTNGKQLPVYTDYRNGRTRVLTLVRKFDGDSEALAGELKKVCGGTSVAVRNGRIEVKGHHRGVIKEYLQGMGF